MPRATDHRTGSGEWSGSAPFVASLGEVTGSGSGAVTSAVFVVPFDCVVKDLIYVATTSITNAAALINFNINGAAEIADFSVSALAAGAVADVLAAADGEIALSRGDRLTFDLEQLASYAGAVTIVCNPQ